MYIIIPSTSIRYTVLCVQCSGNIIYRLISQSLVCDLTVCPALFNPCAAEFVAKLLPQLPSIQQTSALTGSEDALRLCKTGMYNYSHSK